MKKLVWTTQKRTVNDLLPFEKNPRTISPKQLSDLKKSLKKFNLVEIPAIDSDNRILAGHQRLKVLQLLGRGDEEIDVRVPNRKLTDQEAEQYLISSNALGGDWDFEKLKAFELDLLLDVGFDQIDLAHHWDTEADTKDDDFDVSRELEKIKQPKTKLGDLITIGNHRLICGDSTDPTVLARLFGDHKASMIYSDPVYNINVDYNKGIGGKQNYGGSVNDNKSEAEYRQLLSGSLKNALSVSLPDTHVFYWCDQTYIWLLQTLYREHGIANKRVCLWVKNGHNPTPGVAFNKCYEPCVYGVRGKPYLAKNSQGLHEIQNKEVGTGNKLLEDLGALNDLWLSKRLSSKEYEHATSKPPTLHHNAILRCTKPGEIILDSFAGSGSTFVAGHQLKRRVFGVELEPIFCDLIIKRLERLTGHKATTHHG